MNKTESFKKIYNQSELEPLPPAFRIGTRMMYGRISTDSAYETGQVFKIPNIGVGLPYGVTLRDAGPSLYTDQLIHENKFSLKSWDLDIEFEIGDKVVVSNWDDPIDMLTVKQIQGFTENKESGDIIFTMTDKNEKIYNYKYIDGFNHSVNIGNVRKIVNRFGDLTAGMKITAHTAGIQMFPKKDTNIIIGFFTDTGGSEPLVLCSNACTLWYSDILELFDIIPMTSEAWKNKKHAPITPSKMRIQAGDKLNGKSRFKNKFGYIAYRPRESRTIRALNLSYYNSYEDSFVFDKAFTRDVVFDGFPNPRISSKQEDEMGFINAFPNFHGMYIQTNKYHSPYLFPNDKRSILNVSNSSE